MSSPIKTYTIDELIARLTAMPSDTKVFLSRDEEGNGYGTITQDSFSFHQEDKSLIIYPIQEGLEFDDVAPLAYERENEELQTEDTELSENEA